jgi:hypothetical protein
VARLGKPVPGASVPVRRALLLTVFAPPANTFALGLLALILARFRCGTAVGIPRGGENEPWGSRGAPAATVAGGGPAVFAQAPLSCPTWSSLHINELAPSPLTLHISAGRAEKTARNTEGAPRVRGAETC